jgi:hypothetical protein
MGLVDINLRDARRLLTSVLGKRLAAILILIVVLGAVAGAVVQLDSLRERLPGIATFIETSWARVMGSRHVSSTEICGGQIRTINDGRVLSGDLAGYWLYSRTIRIDSLNKNLLGVRFEARSNPGADLMGFFVRRDSGFSSPFDDYGQLEPEGIYFFVYKPENFLKFSVIAKQPELVEIKPEFKCL